MAEKRENLRIVPLGVIVNEFREVRRLIHKAFGTMMGVQTPLDILQDFLEERGLQNVQAQKPLDASDVAPTASETIESAMDSLGKLVETMRAVQTIARSQAPTEEPKACDCLALVGDLVAEEFGNVPWGSVTVSGESSVAQVFAPVLRSAIRAMLAAIGATGASKGHPVAISIVVGQAPGDGFCGSRIALRFGAGSWEAGNDWGMLMDAAFLGEGRGQGDLVQSIALHRGQFHIDYLDDEVVVSVLIPARASGT